MVVLPQFPLGTVLFPSMTLPLHIFEPRYRALIDDVIAGDGTFGVVLIERGSEVGGDDQRSTFGTIAKVVEARQLSDGRWAVIVVGTERFAVTAWLKDQPYPQAEIELWPEPTAPPGLEQPYDEVVTKFTRCLALASESGLDVGPLPEIADDVDVGCLQMAAFAPVGPLDKQALLGAAGPGERLEMLDEMLDGALQLIQLRLGD